MWSPTIFSTPWAWALASTIQQDTHTRTHITYDSNKYFHFPWIYERWWRRKSTVGGCSNDSDFKCHGAILLFYFFCVSKSVTKIEKVTQTKCKSKKRSLEVEEMDTSEQWRQEGQWQWYETSGREEEEEHFTTHMNYLHVQRW